MPEIEENLIFFASQENGIATEKLMRKMEIGNRNTFYDLIKSMEESGRIETKKIGRTRHVYVKSIDKKVNLFIKHFGKRLDQYEESINRNFTLLEKNLPLISEKQPMKPVKVKVPQLKRIKKTKSEWTYKEQGTVNQRYMTWKPRAKPLKYFDSTTKIF